MTGISFSGLASGLDTTAIINSLVGVERIPRTRLEQQNNALASKGRIVDSLSTALASLKTATDALSTAGSFLSYSGTVSDTTVAKVTTTGDSVPGTYQIEVSALARAQRTYSTTFADASAPMSASAQTLSLTIGGTVTNVAVAANASLRDVANAINASGASASAGVLFDGTQYRLQVVGRNTGAANAITFADSGLGLSLDTPANTVQAATDAALTVDGFPVTSGSNLLDGILPGTTLELSKVTTAPVELQIKPDSSAVKAKLQSFVDAYNSVAKIIAAQSGVGKGTETLNGDSTVRTIEQGLSSLISNPIPGLVGAGGTTMQLGDLGIETQRDGTLTLNADTVDKKLAADFSQTASYFAGDGTSKGMGALMDALLDGYTNSVDGLLTTRKKGLTETMANNTTKISDMDAYLDRYEQSLKAQYSALEQTMSQLQSQQSYLAQFLK